MFGLLIPSRPILTQPTTTHSATQCSFTLPTKTTFTHNALYLNKSTTLPPDTLAAIYLQLPSSPEFKLLGALAPDKQSAMFKVNAGRGASDPDTDVKEEVMIDDATEAPVAAAGDVVVGVSIEPAAQVRAQLGEQKGAQANGAVAQQGTSAQQQGAPSGEMVKTLAQRIGRNAFNFLASFTEVGSGGKEVVPIRAFEDWWGKFEKKVLLDPGFLMREGDG